LKAKTKIIAIILGIIVLAIQQWRIGQLETTIDTAIPVDTIVIQGKIDTINIIDTLVNYKTKIVHKTDTVTKENVVIIYDTTIVYKQNDLAEFDINFVDSIKNPFVSVFGKANYPSGQVTLIYRNKLTLKGLENKMRFYSGLGYGKTIGVFTMVNVSYSSYQAQALLYKQGLGFSLGKKF